ncbi:MAG: methylenetetrahydrofolate--tRNA-(uracil(54)-C(5))-methyltransferase (FADH(2)-oxidizing) TrmFO [Deltaproteobacteria bacterium]|nr:methylenetetrahydrofolate--tRNA-(uracil(54)-C(5))-methyltransferase (FADH(2)-oxidizing) TrmFO [Deltaproteobacteria bacterium]
MNRPLFVCIIGGGLAGCEAAWQLARKGIEVELNEMKPHRYSQAHRSERLAELVCSNSLRSNSLDSAVGLLKEEMRLMGSLVMEAADATAVPAGRALAVDRMRFSMYIEEKLESLPSLRIVRKEMTDIPEAPPVIIASGPLTSDALAESIAARTGKKHLYFYDAISPIIEGDSINYDKTFRASRYDEGEGDYLNFPLDEGQYNRLWKALLEGEQVKSHAFETMRYFEGCLPIEIIAARGLQTLAFGPMKPVGLIDPRTGRQPCAVVQLRREDLEGHFYNMVGFQTKLTWPEQRRIFRMIPGLERAEFTRYGSIHRNTFIDAPELLLVTLQLKLDRRIFFSGQLSGVEGYVESAAMGLISGVNIFSQHAGRSLSPPPATTALGSLLRAITKPSNNFQPISANFSLFPPLTKKVRRAERGSHYAQRSLKDLQQWLKEKE